MKTVSRVLTVFLMLGCAGAGLAADEPEPTRAADLLPPVRLTAGGQPILAEGRFASPAMGDFDGDGLLDLLVGDTWHERVELPELTQAQQAAEKELVARRRTLDSVVRALGDAPENESRKARLQRQKKYLKAWREAATVRAEEWEFFRPQSRHYGCVWLFERTAAEAAKQ